MSDIKNLKSKPPDIMCPECNSKLHPQLVKILMGGSDVFCETCGFPFTGIQNGHVKPLSKPTKAHLSEDNITKREDQWAKWKENWQKIKVDWKKQWKEWKQETKSNLHETYSTHETHDSILESKPLVPNPNSSSSPTENTLPSQSSTQEVSHSLTHSHNFNPSNPKSSIQYRDEGLNSYYRKIWTLKDDKPSDKDDYNIPEYLKALDSMHNAVRPFYMVILMITAIIFVVRIQNSISAMNMLGILLIEVIVMEFDNEVFLPQEKLYQVKNVGLGMIMVGALTVRAYGIGLLLLARGIIYVMTFIEYNVHNKITHPALVDNPYKVQLWMKEIVRSFIPYFDKLVFGYFVAGISSSIAHIESKGVAYMVVTIVFCSVSYGIFKGSIQKELEQNYYSLNKIPFNSKILLVILGLFSIGNGAGLPFLVMGILLLILEDNSTELMFRSEDIALIQGKIVVMDSLASQSDFNSQILSQDNENLDRKYDPMTGKLHGIIASKDGDNTKQYSPSFQYGAIPQSTNNLSHTFSTSPMPKISVPSAEPSSNDQITVKPPSPQKEPQKEDTNQRIFNVLTPQIRGQLLQLALDTDELNEICRSFTYLDENQQQTYLNDLKTIHTEEIGALKQYHNRIQSLPISKDQQTFLIKQLAYLPEQELEEFVSILEQSAQGS